MGRYIKGSVNEEFPLSTLAGRTLLGKAVTETVNERTFVSSIRATWSLNEFTKGTDVGPIQVGVAHSDYSDAEIEEWLETTASWNEGDLVQQEVGSRRCRNVGVFEVPFGAAESRFLNDGKPITTKLGWILLQGQTVKLWAYNLGAAALLTTDPNVLVVGHANLWPR